MSSCSRGRSTHDWEGYPSYHPTQPLTEQYTRPLRGKFLLRPARFGDSSDSECSEPPSPPPPPPSLLSPSPHAPPQGRPCILDQPPSRLPYTPSLTAYHEPPHYSAPREPEVYQIRRISEPPLGDDVLNHSRWRDGVRAHKAHGVAHPYQLPREDSSALITTLPQGHHGADQHSPNPFEPQLPTAVFRDRQEPRPAQRQLQLPNDLTHQVEPIFASTTSPTPHLSQMPPSPDASSGPERRFPCDTCGRSYTRQSSLNTHVRSHKRTQPFNCPVDGCFGQFTYRTHVWRHCRNVHGIEDAYTKFYIPYD